MASVDLKVWVFAVATLVGSFVASDVPFVVLALGAVGLGALRRWWALALVALLLSSQMASWVVADLGPVGELPFSGTVTLTSDPQPIGSALRADAATPLGTLQLRARGRSADDLRPLLAGDTVAIAGRVTPRADDADWLLQRKVVGLLRVDRIEGYRPATGLIGIANAFRETLERGSESLGAERQTLFTGLVVGDDRWQSAQTSDDFRGSGLGHLLAVSGQNVAFVLLIVMPLVRLLPVSMRIGVVLFVLVLFGLVTRFEPSVLRASVMAGLAVVSVAVGRPGSGLRLLGACVVGLLWWDPLLGRSVGFQLSVVASLGILVVSPVVVRAMADRLMGPAWLRELVGATIGAQVAVAPLLLWVFDDVPVAALPANVLAGPASGPVMAWGLTGGFLAGLSSPGLAALLHVPTGWLLGWIAGVAGWASSVGWGSYGWRHVVALFLIVLAMLVVRLSSVRWFAVAVGLIVAPGPVLVGDVGDGVVVDGGLSVWRSGGVTVVEVGSGARAERSLALLRGERVRNIHLLVVDGAGNSTVEALIGRYDPQRVVAVDDPGALRSEFRVGDLWVRFANSSRGVQVLVDRTAESRSVE